MTVVVESKSLVPDELDMDGIIDAERGVEYVGKATRAYEPERCPRHPPPSTLRACACRWCGAWIWEGVTMCRKPVVGEGPCTRAARHEGQCEARELRSGQAPT